MRYLSGRATALLSRTGESCDILRATKGAKDSFGKSSSTWASVATEPVVLDQSGGHSMENLTYSGGEITRSTPNLYFIADSAVQDDDRVRVNGVLYEVGAPVSYPTHTVVEGTSVDESV